MIVTELIQWHQAIFPVDLTNYNAVHNSLEICKVLAEAFSIKYFIYELPHKLLNDLNLRILGN